MNEDHIVRTVACAIARTTGIEFDEAPKNKSDWTAKRGMFDGRFRDVNEPMQGDFLDMAEAALAAIALVGLKVVEREATAEMVIAALKERDRDMPLFSQLAAAWDAAPPWPGAKE